MKVCKFQYSFSFDIHIRTFDLTAYIVHHRGNVLGLIFAAMRPQPLDERGQRLFKHDESQEAMAQVHVD